VMSSTYAPSRAAGNGEALVFPPARPWRRAGGARALSALGIGPKKRQRMFRRFEVHFWTMVALLAGYGLYGLGKLIVVCWVN